MKDLPRSQKFSLPFFIALVLMLCTFSYKFGTLFDPSSKINAKSVYNLSGQVLGLNTVYAPTERKVVIYCADGSSYETTNGKEVAYDRYGKIKNNTEIPQPSSVKTKNVKEYPNAYVGLLSSLFDAYLYFIAK